MFMTFIGLWFLSYLILFVLLKNGIFGFVIKVMVVS